MAVVAAVVVKMAPIRQAQMAATAVRVPTAVVSSTARRERVALALEHCQQRALPVPAALAAAVAAVRATTAALLLRLVALAVQVKTTMPRMVPVVAAAVVALGMAHRLCMLVALAETTAAAVVALLVRVRYRNRAALVRRV